MSAEHGKNASARGSHGDGIKRIASVRITRNGVEMSKWIVGRQKRQANFIMPAMEAKQDASSQQSTRIPPKSAVMRLLSFLIAHPTNCVIYLIYTYQNFLRTVRVR